MASPKKFQHMSLLSQPEVPCAGMQELMHWYFMDTKYPHPLLPLKVENMEVSPTGIGYLVNMKGFPTSLAPVESREHVVCTVLQTRMGMNAGRLLAQSFLKDATLHRGRHATNKKRTCRGKHSLVHSSLTMDGPGLPPAAHKMRWAAVLEHVRMGMKVTAQPFLSEQHV
eukprot:1157637-Pelagomonas_calceolata.AAC.14